MPSTGSRVVGGIFACLLVALPACAQVSGLDDLEFDRDRLSGSGGAGGIGGMGGQGSTSSGKTTSTGTGTGGSGTTSTTGTGGAPPCTDDNDCDDGDPCTDDVCGPTGCESSLAPGAECTPDEMSSEACGNCGMRVRTCGQDCKWGAFGACGAEGACAPGQTDSEGCGNCGSRTRTCGQDCSWGAFGACNGEGPCAPGQTMPGGCDPCSVQVCQGNCQWGGCQLAAGNVCEWKNGTNFQCCGAGKWQFCSKSTCNWFPCAACNGCGC